MVPFIKKEEDMDDTTTLSTLQSVFLFYSLFFWSLIKSLLTGPFSHDTSFLSYTYCTLLVSHQLAGLAQAAA
jgi:hypothetical protein